MSLDWSYTERSNSQQIFINIIKETNFEFITFHGVQFMTFLIKFNEAFNMQFLNAL